MDKPGKMLAGDEMIQKVLDDIKKDFENIFASITIGSDKTPMLSLKEFYSRKMKEKSESYSGEWLGTLYYNYADIQVDYEDRPSRPLASAYGITFVREIIK